MFDCVQLAIKYKSNKQFGTVIKTINQIRKKMSEFDYLAKLIENK